MSEIRIFNEEILAMVNDPDGQIAKELQRQGNRVVAFAKEKLSTPTTREPNPPPGPPRKDTGQLHDSIRRRDAEIGAEGVEVLVVAHAISRGQGHDYSIVLRDPELLQRGGGAYWFVTEDQLEELNEGGGS